MKNFILVFSVVLAFSTVSGGYFDDPGIISGWKFSPLQVDAGLVEHRKLVDESSNTAIALGVFLLEQKSAVISLSLLANTLYNNYGIQISPLFIGCATDYNYGISIGFENYCKNCYGIQIGVLNHSWAGKKIEKPLERLQILGINIADTFFLGVINITEKLQIGLLNLSPGGAIFQLGILNYNPKSFIPWMPLINFDMGR